MITLDYNESGSANCECAWNVSYTVEGLTSGEWLLVLPGGISEAFEVP